MQTSRYVHRAWRHTHPDKERVRSNRLRPRSAQGYRTYSLIAHPGICRRYLEIIMTLQEWEYVFIESHITRMVRDRANTIRLRLGIEQIDYAGVKCGDYVRDSTVAA